MSTPTPPPTTKATNPPSILPDFASVFKFNNRVTILEHEVAELKKDPLHTQVTDLVDEHLDAKLGATRDEFMNFLLKSLIVRITKQVKRSTATYSARAKESSQPQSSYEAAATLIEFKLKRILIDKMDRSQSYLTASKHRECYDGLNKSYDLDKSLFSTYGNVYSLKRSQNDKDKDEDPSAGSDQGLKKRKTSKDAEPTKKKPKYEIAYSDIPQDQEENLGNDGVEPKEKQGQNQRWLMTLASSAEKPLKTFDELMSTPIDFSAFIMNGLKIDNLTQETLLGPAFKLLKGTRSNYAELEYDFEECYKALSEKLDWENPEGGDYYIYKEALKTWLQIYGFLLKLPMINMHYGEFNIGGNYVEVMRKHGYGYLKDIVVRRADNVLYRFKKGDCPRLRVNDIEDMLLLVVQNRLTNLSGDDVSDFPIALRMFTKSLVIQKRVEDL
ncbi:hypothetical protein Tco_1226811 [Tanacetum coccineum]